MVFFNALELVLAVLGVFFGVAVLWKSLKHRLSFTARDQILWRRLAAALFAILIAGGICRLVANPDAAHRLFYGGVSLLLVAALWLMQLADNLRTARQLSTD